MKIFLIILGLLIVLFSLAFFFGKIRLKLYLSKQGYIVVQFLFLKYTIDLYGKKHKKEKTKPNKKTDKKAKKDGYVKKLYKQKGVLDATTEILSVIKEIFLKIASLFSQSTIEEFNLELTVSEKDPALTAITYGAASTLVYTTVGLLNGILPIKKQNVNLVANYDKEKTNLVFYAYATVHFKNAVSAAGLFLKEYIKTHIK